MIKIQNKLLFLTFIYFLGIFLTSKSFDFNSIKNFDYNSLIDKAKPYKEKVSSFFDFHNPEIKKLVLMSTGVLVTYYLIKYFKVSAKKNTVDKEVQTDNNTQNFFVSDDTLKDYDNLTKTGGEPLQKIFAEYGISRGNVLNIMNYETICKILYQQQNQQVSCLDIRKKV